MSGKRGRVRRVLVGAAVAVGAVALILVSVTWWRATSAPVWWAESGRLPPDAPARADALERGAMRAIYEPAPVEERERIHGVAIMEADANAWLAERLGRWAVNRGMDWPLVGGPGVAWSAPRVRFEDDRVTLGVEINGRVVGVSARARVVEGEGPRSLFLRDVMLMVGRIEVGARSVPDLRWWMETKLGMIGWRAPDGVEVDDIAAMLRGERPVWEGMVFELEDGRRVEVRGVRVEEGRVVIEIGGDGSGGGEAK